MIISNEFLNSQRLIADSKADELVSAMFLSNRQQFLYAAISTDWNNYQQIQDTDLSNFLLSKKPNPEWYNHDAILRGQQFYKKYATQIMTLLGGLSLPYCYAATPGNKALYFSEKMRKNPAKRLWETAAFIIHVCSPYAFFEGNAGYFEINKIRLIHAIARYYMHKSGQWDMAWGQPINQEDMAGTNLAFSYMILLGLKKTNYYLNVSQQKDFLALWRYVGYQMDIDENLLPATMSEAASLELAIRKRHFRFSEEAKILSSELITYYQSITPPAQASLMAAQVRYWLGSFAADCIGLPKDKVKDSMVFILNLIKDSINPFYIDPHSFENMMKNHKMLKEKYVR